MVNEARMKTSHPTFAHTQCKLGESSEDTTETDLYFNKQNKPAFLFIVTP